jgi:hypothetical protein
MSAAESAADIERDLEAAQALAEAAAPYGIELVGPPLS